MLSLLLLNNKNFNKLNNQNKISNMINITKNSINRLFHSNKILLGLEEFIEIKKANEVNVHGRSWTPVDLRKKVIIIMLYIKH